MTIPPDIESWAKGQVSSGRYASIEDAIMDTVRASALRDGDFGWARPMLDEARQQAARGETVVRSVVTEAMRSAIGRHSRDG